MTLKLTTVDTLVASHNANIEAFAPYPVGKLVDAIIGPVPPSAKGNTQIRVVVDNYYNKPVPPNMPDSLRYTSVLRYITRVDISSLPGAVSTSGTPPAITAPQGMDSTASFLTAINSLLSLDLSPADIVVEPVEPITGLTPVTIEIDPGSVRYFGSITLNVLPSGPVLVTPPVVPPVVVPPVVVQTVPPVIDTDGDVDNASTGTDSGADDTVPGGTGDTTGSDTIPGGTA